MRGLIILAALLLGGVAFAEGATILDVPGFDSSSLRVLGSSVSALGLAVFSFVASAKRATEAQGRPIILNPWAWRGLSFLAGLLAAFALHYSGFGAQLPVFGWAGWAAVLAYGVAAGLVAILGRDAVKTVLSWVTVGLATALAWRATPVEVSPASPFESPVGAAEVAPQILPPDGVIAPDPRLP